MDGLEALTAPVGATMAGYNAGLKTARDYEEQQNQQALRNAQMQEIMQRTAAAKEAAPLELETKRLANEKTQLANKAAQMDAYSETLSRVSAGLEDVPAASRHARLIQSLQGSGVDMANPEIASFVEQMKNVSGDQLPSVLSKLNERLITESSKYKTELAKANVQKASHLEGIQMQGQTQRDIEQMRIKSREGIADAKTRGTANIQELVRSGKMTAEKAAVALYGAAQFAEDPVEAQRLMQMAGQYEQFAMQQRQAQSQGKPDVGAMTGLPTQTLPPALGTGPKLGTKENPIVLK